MILLYSLQLFKRRETEGLGT